MAFQGLSVLCDESGHTEFPFSYLAHVTLLTPAQGRLRIGSGLAQACSPYPKNYFRKAAPQHNYFNSSRASPELVPYIKRAKTGPRLSKANGFYSNNPLLNEGHFTPWNTLLPRLPEYENFVVNEV